MAEYDLVVRGGTVADGTGGALVDADVAVKDGRIAAVGAGLKAGAEEIDARGLVVTPGFVDVHTHYDGQAVWDDRLQPSTQHGATTVVMGNCGVGFAPCRPSDHDALISLMEGVEDIPGAVMAEGLDWTWETFPQYLDAIAKRPRDADFAAFVPHGPVRVYAMGERAIAREAATDDDIALMRRLVEDGLRAGAVGFSTSRTLAHRTAAGEFTPTYRAAHHELRGVGAALKVSPGAAFQMITDWDDLDAEFAALTDIVRDGGGKGTFTLLQNDATPSLWRDVVSHLEAANAAGADITAQAIARPIGVLMGLDASMHTFRFRPTYKAIAHLPLKDKVARLRDPEVKRAILSETDEDAHIFIKFLGARLDRFFALGASEPEYMPNLEACISARAQRAERDPFEFLYDVLLEEEGRALIYVPLTNFTDPTGGVIKEMLFHPQTVPALGDGGAHVGTICDASVSTFLLTEWVRKRKEMTLEHAVHRLTQKPARMFRFNDRGVIAQGMKADLNVIDLDALAIEPPRMSYDLPAGGKRLLQASRGYRATVLSGQITYRDGVATNRLPGKLLRGAQAA
ncbi:MAG: amidohydrolase family protein [Hyphomonadaceae bacterium]|nr:amidohydrolase family protein [Hyphomonadaceae bacterium]